MEEPFVGRNSKTAIILGMARGGILAALAVRGVPAYSYMPSVAKRAAVGNGGAAKEQVAYLLAAELKINVNDIPLDCTDALSLAICHAQRAFHSELNGLGKSI
jgi:crossover junction endodeoxyribonuclease RuvC